MLEWLGEEGEQLRIAFTKVFGSTYEKFGSPALQIGGLSDGRKGVQWHAGYDPRDGSRFAGVNLEGIAYQNWPVALLIERELRGPSLVGLVAKGTGFDDVVLEWRRDYWQKQSRPSIEEHFISPTPMPLAELTNESWRDALRGASECLDAAKRRRGRATQTVTLSTGEQVSGQVSPHLTVEMRSTGDETWEDFFRRVKTTLQPIHAWARARSTEQVSF